MYLDKLVMRVSKDSNELSRFVCAGDVQKVCTEIKHRFELFWNNLEENKIKTNDFENLISATSLDTVKQYRYLSFNGRSVAHIIVEYGAVDLMKLLIHKAPDLMLVKDNDGATPLQYSLSVVSSTVNKRTRKEMLQCILNTTTNVNNVNVEDDKINLKEMFQSLTNDNKSIIHYAAQEDEVDLLEMILLKAKELNIDLLDLKESDGENTLSIAIRAGNEDNVNMLLSYGANIFAQVKGKPLLALAETLINSKKKSNILQRLKSTMTKAMNQNVWNENDRMKWICESKVNKEIRSEIISSIDYSDVDMGMDMGDAMNTQEDIFINIKDIDEGVDIEKGLKMVFEGSFDIGTNELFESLIQNGQPKNRHACLFIALSYCYAKDYCSIPMDIILMIEKYEEMIYSDSNNGQDKLNVHPFYLIVQGHLAMKLNYPLRGQALLYMYESKFGREYKGVSIFSKDDLKTIDNAKVMAQKNGKDEDEDKEMELGDCNKMNDVESTTVTTIDDVIKRKWDKIKTKLTSKQQEPMNQLLFKMEGLYEVKKIALNVFIDHLADLKLSKNGFQQSAHPRTLNFTFVGNPGTL